MFWSNVKRATRFKRLTLSAITLSRARAAAAVMKPRRRGKQKGRFPPVEKRLRRLEDSRSPRRPPPMAQRVPRLFSITILKSRGTRAASRLGGSNSI